MNLLALLPTQYALIVTVAIVIDGLICTILPTPTKPDGVYAKVFMVMNKIACNFGKAANAILLAPK